ncbi:MAG: ribosome assembly factor SBDS [Nanoarchaeota archaeon]|nr:ribosome assembly factor SBDS [Nanoarchaeota archaeon]
MIDVNKAIIVRLKKAGEVFEVLVDCEKAIDFKSGKLEDISEVLASERIYKDVKKGDKASENEMEKIFGTSDFKEVAEKIIKKGEMHVTAEHKAKLREEKKKKLIELIHRNAIDSKTGLPHPVNRIEAAMDEAKVHIDEFKNAEAQMEDILEKLRSIIPIKFVKKTIEIKIPAQYTGNVYRIIKQFGDISKENWGNDGSLTVQIEIPGGLQEEFFDKLNGLTHGEVESRIVKEN